MFVTLLSLFEDIETCVEQTDRPTCHRAAFCNQKLKNTLMNNLFSANIFYFSDADRFKTNYPFCIEL